MKRPTHILVIRLSALGDVAMTVPILRVVVKTYPELKLTVVSRAFYKPLFDGIPNINFLEADVYGKHKGIGLLKLAKEARKLGIDAVADLHSVIRSKVITNFLGFSGVKTAVIDKGRTEKKELTRAEHRNFKPLKSTHQRYADVFKNLGLPIDLYTHQFPDKKNLSPNLIALIGPKPKKLIGIAPFAAFKSKMYPLNMMTEVIKKLDVTSNYHVFLFGGGKEEKELLLEIDSQFESVTSVADVFSFQEELALISNLDTMLSMDSGNGHLSALFGIPTITLWGVTHPYAGFTPFQQPEENQLLANQEEYPLIPTSIYGNKFPKEYESAIATIPPYAIIERLLKII
jgi:ADP-heptose:LPS heptosyltransferase